MIFSTFRQRKVAFAKRRWHWWNIGGPCNGGRLVCRVGRRPYRCRLSSLIVQSSPHPPNSTLRMCGLLKGRLCTARRTSRARCSGIRNIVQLIQSWPNWPQHPDVALKDPLFPEILGEIPLRSLKWMRVRLRVTHPESTWPSLRQETWWGICQTLLQPQACIFSMLSNLRKAEVSDSVLGSGRSASIWAVSAELQGSIKGDWKSLRK